MPAISTAPEPLQRVAPLAGLSANSWLSWRDHVDIVVGDRRSAAQRPARTHPPDRARRSWRRARRRRRRRWSRRSGHCRRRLRRRTASPSGALAPRTWACQTVPPFSGLIARTTALVSMVKIRPSPMTGEDASWAWLLLPSPVLDPPGHARRGAEGDMAHRLGRIAARLGPFRIGAAPAAGSRRFRSGRDRLPARARGKGRRCARRPSGSRSSCLCRRGRGCRSRRAGWRPRGRVGYRFI